MENERYSRQSFLGPDAQDKIASCRAGVAGLGGGGSHVVQQLAHIGFKKYALFDGDIAKDVNLNRNVGTTLADVEGGVSKLDIARRTILGLQQDADIIAVPGRWQDNADVLKRCDIVFGCVDSFSERDQLERCARRYLIPLIDIGMDVLHPEGDPAPTMSGQLILSMPGGPCMKCLGFLTDQRLAQEASRYGAAGPRPQVVWPNGILASSAVGVAVDLITDWTRSLRGVVYRSYSGNTGLIEPHARLPYLDLNNCSHFPVEQVGDPVFRKL
ncbi:MAG: ThiF family adenylyltransferase [Elusimicrobia bacterium]|nr:ThiF family adenylyltransferase [Elusimicrobiota bacterium]MDE2425926.1 ThiF family adenylyltransferase [Elusimicrobiota bacterium]